MKGRDFLRRLGLGRALYHLWHRPRGTLHNWRRTGVSARIAAHRGEREMIAAAFRLPVQEIPDPHSPTVHFLTGERFWHQTLYCAATLSYHAGRSIRLALWDDGSLLGPMNQRIEAHFPGAVTVHSRAESDERFHAAFPERSFPFLHRRRPDYPNLRKLTDIHAGNRGWHLVLDSDMLFFQRPDALLQWLATPTLPLLMSDVQDAYGHSREFLATLCGAPVPAAINVGVCGLQSESLDWERIEHWLRRMIESSGTSYYEEQALVAMIAAQQGHKLLPRDAYLLLPGEKETRRPSAVLHHYVADSRLLYYRFGWRAALERMGR